MVRGAGTHDCGFLGKEWGRRVSRFVNNSVGSRAQGLPWGDWGRGRVALSVRGDRGDGWGAGSHWLMSEQLEVSCLLSLEIGLVSPPSVSKAPEVKESKYKKPKDKFIAVQNPYLAKTRRVNLMLSPAEFLNLNYVSCARRGPGKKTFFSFASLKSSGIKADFADIMEIYYCLKKGSFCSFSFTEAF